MTLEIPEIDNIDEGSRAEKMLNKLPRNVQEWAESLAWSERRYVLSLCHLLCGASPEDQASFLDDYTADGLIGKILEDQDAQTQMRFYLTKYHIDTEIKDDVLRKYIRQFFIHSAHYSRRQPEQYLESALRFVANEQEQQNLVHYILGFEIIRMFFKMSWQQQERLYKLQVNQDYFFNKYIKPIQHTHRINNIIVPKDERVFFAKRDYFVQIPKISEHKLIQLILATFSLHDVIELGFSVSRNLKSLIFDYEYIFQHEDENFTVGEESG